MTVHISSCWINYKNDDATKQFWFMSYHNLCYSETTDIGNYCLVAGKALLFLLSEDNYNYWVAELKRKNKSNKETAETTQMCTQKYTKGTQGGNGRSFGGWNDLAKIRFNEYVDIIEEFNKNKEKVEACNKALKKACEELKKAKEAKNNRTKKRKLGNMETDFIPARYSLPSSMRKKSVQTNTHFSIYLFSFKFR